MASTTLTGNADYQAWLKEIKQRVVSARVRAAVAVNREMILFYWELGAQIAEKQANSSWGDKLIPQLSADLKKAFPELRGFSASNLKYCLRFYLFFANAVGSAATPFGQQPVDQIPWGHNILIFTKCASVGEAGFYIAQTNEVEFALRDMNKPMGVSEYTLVETLPDNLKGAMPTVEEIEQDLKQLKAEDDEHE